MKLEHHGLPTSNGLQPEAEQALYYQRYHFDKLPRNQSVKLNRIGLVKRLYLATSIQSVEQKT